MRSLFAIGLLLVVCCQTAQAAPYADWARESIQSIKTSFLLQNGRSYAEEITPGTPAAGKPCFSWSGGVLLTALAAASREDAGYEPALRSLLKELENYRVKGLAGIPGYGDKPHTNPPDIYYDDDEWLVLGMVEAYEATQDRAILKRAEETMRLVMSGEDNVLGGGIYWREKEKTSKNTCSNGPAIAAALRLYGATHRPEYLALAQRLYAWTNAHLQDADGLYWDNINLNGQISRDKWTYNTALMLRSNVLFFQLTHDPKYRAEAQRIAKAAVARWVDPETGGIRDEACFAHLLCEAFLYLSEIDADPTWTQVASRAVQFVHDRSADAQGFHAERWASIPPAPLTKARLITESSAARAFWMAARYHLP